MPNSSPHALLTHARDTMIEPAYRLLPTHMNSREATVMLLAIGQQESRFQHRRQINGPARGFWQFEEGGGVKGVMHSERVGPAVDALLLGCGIDPSALTHTVYEALEQDDVLAAGFARLLLWLTPGKLPMLGDPQAAWNYYVAGWRPGKPHRQTWDAFYANAMEASA